MTKGDVASAVVGIKSALVDADVALSVVDTFCDDVAQGAVGVMAAKDVTAEEYFTKIVYDELVKLLGGTPPPEGVVPLLQFGTQQDPCVILLCGLQGSGKTTFAAKLARYLSEREDAKDWSANMTSAHKTNPKHKHKSSGAPIFNSRARLLALAPACLRRRGRNAVDIVA